MLNQMWPIGQLWVKYFLNFAENGDQSTQQMADCSLVENVAATFDGLCGRFSALKRESPPPRMREGGDSLGWWEESAEFMAIQAAGRIVRLSVAARVATARRLAKKALRRSPRSHGMRILQFSVSSIADLIQRGVLVMGFSSCVSYCSMDLM